MRRVAMRCHLWRGGRHGEDVRENLLTQADRLPSDPAPDLGEAKIHIRHRNLHDKISYCPAKSKWPPSELLICY